MHSYNFDNTTPTHKFIFILPSKLNGRFDVIDKYFIAPFIEKGGKLDDITLVFTSAGLTKNADFYKKQISLITKLLKVTQTPYIYIADSKLFTKLTGKTSPTRYFGLPIKINIEESPNTLCYVGINPETALISDALSQALIKSTNAFTNAINTKAIAFTPQILKSTRFIFEVDEVKAALQEYFKLPTIACDIETKSLNHTLTGIETIAFAKNAYEGFGISVDRNDPEKAKQINSILKVFFQKYKGKIVWHGGKFDRRIITHNYYTVADSPMYRVEQHEDTIVMAYCCLNSVEKPSYKLKDLAFEFLGDYGIDVKDTTAVDINTLLDYNIHDACATFYLYEKFKPLLEIEGQAQIYKEIFMPSINTLVKTELHGIPVCPKATKDFIALLKADKTLYTQKLQSLQLVKDFTNELKQAHCDQRNDKLKTKVILITDDECDKIVFNPNSGQQCQKLLYDKLKLPVLGRTKSKAPSTDKDTLAMLINHVKEGTPEHDIVSCLNELSKCKTILATFIPILKEAITTNLKDGVGYIYGSFNIPGTITGRLSSSDPNLQNMPSTGTKYAKAFKSCLIAPPGKVLVGIDFDSLEDRIGAKTTQDPNKLKVYTDGFDGHGLRAYNYYPDDIPRMDVTPANIDQLCKDYKKFRQDSKAITFALTYLGTYSTLMKNCGLSKEEALRIEASYHEMYKVADAHVQKRLEQAAKDGFIVGAFGFKLRAEILKRVLINSKNTPHSIQKMLRTLGNMLGQSYGLLNSRAGNETFNECTKHNLHGSVSPIGQIHDSQYFVVDDNPKVVHQLCEILSKAVSWDDLPELQQDSVPLSGTPQLSFKSWAELEDIKYKDYSDFRMQYDSYR